MRPESFGGGMAGTLFMVLACISAASAQKDVAKAFLEKFKLESGERKWTSAQASWLAATNITDYNNEQETAASLVYSDFMKAVRQNASAIDQSDADDDTKRQFKLLLQTMTSKDREVVMNASVVASKMNTIYSTGKVPMSPLIKSITVPKGTEYLSLDKHLVEIMANSRDPEELLYAWKNWRNATKSIRDWYTEYVRLSNIGAKENGWKDAGDYKRRARYEVDNLQSLTEEFWNELKPFYEEVHAYVRFRLSKEYPDLVKDAEPIPAHLLGNMWAQAWDNIYERIAPFKDQQALDVTPQLVAQGYTAKKMFEVAEEFFTSIGWQKLPASFWTKSMLEQPTDREVVCHASAWDFSIEKDGSKDVRVKMCTKITQDDFVTIHHELGHIYYDLLYWDQPTMYRDGANPGFHEAVGDVLALSVQTPNHLFKVGLLKKVEDNPKADINFLLKTAMERIAFFPFGYLMDLWMWSVYSGETPPERYNQKWWELRQKYQGVKAPVQRSEEDFDPGAKFHIPNDTPYIRYFIAHLLQFAFHKHACLAANWTGDLHKCSIYQSKEAGKKLGDMLRLGKSKPWSEALKLMTGSEKMSAEPIKEYFKPLITWLKEQRELEGYTLGWDGKVKPTDTPGGAVMQRFSLAVLTVTFLAVYFLSFVN